MKLTTAKQITEVKDNMAALACIDAAIRPDDIQTIAEALPELKARGDINYEVLFEGQDFAAMDNRTISRWDYLLYVSLGNVDVSADWVWLIFQAVMEGRETLSSFLVLEGIDRWMQSWPERIKSLLAEAHSPAASDSPIVRMCLFALIAHDPNGALEAALKLTEDARPNVCEGAIATLGRLVAYSADKKAEIALGDLFDTAVLTSAAEASRGFALKAMLAYRAEPKPTATVAKKKSNTVRHHQLFDPRIQQAIDAPDVHMRANLYSSLCRSPSSLTEAQRETLCMNMHTIPADNFQAIQDAGMALYGLEPITDFVRILRYLKAFLASNHKRKLHELYHLDGKFIDTGADVPLAYAAEMLVDGDIGVADAVPDLFGPLDEAIGVLDLDDDRWGRDLNQSVARWSPAELAYLIRRSIGFLFMQHGAAVSLMGAALVQLVKQSRARTAAGRAATVHRDFALDDIEHIWLRSYPGDITLFDDLAKQAPELKRVVSQLKRNAQAYIDVLSALPMNKAMKPCSSERQVQRERGRREAKEIQEAAHAQSIFASLIHKSVILYGEGVLRQVPAQNGQPPNRNITPMAKIEMSVALPRRNVLHPVHFNCQLIHLTLEAPPAATLETQF